MKDNTYVAGWIKTGPRGVIASTMFDSFETAESLLEDIAIERIELKQLGAWNRIEDKLREKCHRWTTFNDWRKLDEIEKSLGSEKGKIREKIGSIEEMLDRSK